jgi:hypothetical protein
MGRSILGAGFGDRVERVYRTANVARARVCDRKVVLDDYIGRIEIYSARK